MSEPAEYWTCPYCGTMPLPDRLQRAEGAPFTSDPVIYPRNDEHATDCPNYQPRPQPVAFGMTRL